MNAQPTIPLSETEPPEHSVSGENISKAKTQLIGILGPEAVVPSLDRRRAHLITQWFPAVPSQIPALVVFPTSTAEVSAIMKIYS